MKINKTEIVDTRVSISEVEAKLKLLNDNEASGESTQMNLDAITSIRSKVTTLKLQEQELLNKYKPNNIKIINTFKKSNSACGLFLSI